VTVAHGATVRRPRSHIRPGAVIAVCLVAAGALLVARTHDNARTGITDGALHEQELIARYQSAIHDAVLHWGRIEIMGMQPAIADLRRGGDDAPAIAGEAQAWQRGLSGIQASFARVRAPSSLLPSQRLFRAALGAYVDAAMTTVQAARASAAQRDAFIREAVQDAMRGDCLYDQAGVELQAARADADLPATPDFPDHLCPAEVGSRG
jgi:hypothetical protein